MLLQGNIKKKERGFKGFSRIIGKSRGIKGSLVVIAKLEVVASLFSKILI